MKALVLYASSRDAVNDAGASVTYSNVAVIPLEATAADRKDEAGFRPMELRANREPAIQLREAIRSAGPLVCELDLVPQIFGKNQSLQLVAAQPLARLEQLKLTPTRIALAKTPT